MKGGEIMTWCELGQSVYCLLFRQSGCRTKSPNGCTFVALNEVVYFPLTAAMLKGAEIIHCHLEQISLQFLTQLNSLRLVV